MWIELIKAEARSLLGDGQARVGALVCIGMVILCTVSQLEQRAASLREHRVLLTEQERFIESHGELNRIYEMTPLLVDPPQLKVFASGVALELSPGATNEESLSSNPFARAPFSLIFPSFDFITAVAVGLSLVAMLIGSLTIPLAAETGTLRQLLVSNVSRTQLLISKGVGISIAVAGLLISSVAGVIVLTWVHGAFTWTGENAIAFALMCAVLWAYTCANVAIGLLVGTFARSSTNATTAAVGVWVLTTLIAPTAVLCLARALYPLPSMAAVESQVKQLMLETRRQNMQSATERVEARYDALIAPLLSVRGYELKKVKRLSTSELHSLLKRLGKDDYAVARLWKLRQKELVAVEEAEDRKYRQQFNAAISAAQRQIQLQYAAMRIAARFVPALGTALVGTELAGTSVSDRLEAEAQRQSFKDRLVEYAYLRILMIDAPDPWDARIDISDAPKFQYVSRRLTERLQVALPLVIPIPLVGALALMTACRRFRRYDAR